MESIAELKTMCRKRHQKGVTQPHWWATLFARRVSILFTWVLVQTPVSANQMTIWQLIASIIGIVFLSFADIQMALLGVAFLHLGYILDNVDGEIARYKKTQSINGMFLDFVNHETVMPATFFGLGLHYFFQSSDLVYFIAGVTILLTQFQPVGKARMTAIHYLIEKRKSPAYSMSTYQSQPNYRKLDDGERKAQRHVVVRAINGSRRFIRRSLAYPNDVLLISVVLILEYFTDHTITGQVFVVFLAVFLLLNQSLELYIHMKNRVVERDLQSYLLNVNEMYQAQAQENKTQGHETE